MTATEAKALVRAAGGILAAIAAPILLALVVGAWRSRESVEDHNRDVARIESSVQRILDVMCEDNTKARACK